MRHIHTDEIASNTVPLSQGVMDETTIYVSGQVPRTPDGDILDGDIADQTTQTLENIEAIINEGGSSIDDVMKVTVFLTEMGEFSKFNESYREFFDDPYPARSAFGVEELALENIDVEIEAIASRLSENMY